MFKIICGDKFITEYLIKYQIMIQQWKTIFFSLFIHFLSVYAQENTPIEVKEYIVDPRSKLQGSLMGGLELRFRITGLDSDPANNQILLNNNSCLIIDEGSSGQQNYLGQNIRCMTTQTNIRETLLPFLSGYPSQKNDNSINGQIIIKSKGKADKIYNTITQSIAATPILYQILINNLFPEQLILFQYSIWAIDQQFSQFFIGQHLCEFNQSLLSNYLTNYYCKVPQDVEGGLYNITIKAPSGIQYNRPESFQYHAITKQQYQVKVIPYINSISSNLASINGQVLVINGFGFTQFKEKIQLSITGQQITYDVLDANETQIKVMVRNYSNDNNQNKYLQSSGLQYTKYKLSQSLAIQNCSYLRQLINEKNIELEKLIIIENIITTPEQYSIVDTNYGEYYRGYFKAPFDGNYTFLLSSNNNVEFYISQKEVLTDYELKLIAFTNQSNINFRVYNQSSNQTSEVQNLKKDNYYYIEIYHYGNNINSHLTLTVQIQYDSQTITYQPIPNELLYIFSDLPQINLFIQGILAICKLCQYSLTQNSNFQLQTFTKNDQILQLTIRQEDSNVQIILNQLTISYGGVKCYVLNITYVNSNSIVNCLLQQQNGIVFCEAGDNIPIVDIYPLGVINSDSTIQPITQNIVITKVTPSVGSKDGGTYLTIDGEGFPIKNQGSDFIITIGGNRVYATYLDNHRINVVTFQGSSSIEINFNNKTFLSDQFFQYEQTNQIEIYNLSNYNFSPIYKGFLTIYARSLVYDKSVLNVTLENQDKTYFAHIVSIQNDELKVYLRGGMPGNYSINIYKNGQEKSNSESNESNIFQYGAFIQDIQPSQGSLFGGTKLKIIGHNFLIEQSLVFIGKGVNQACEINEQVSNESYIECLTPSKPDIKSYDNPVDIVVVTRASLESICINQQGCKFQYTYESTPKLLGLPEGVQKLGSRLLIEDNEINNQFQNTNKEFIQQLQNDHKYKHHRMNQQSKQHLKQRQLSQFNSYKLYKYGDKEILAFKGELTNLPKIILKGGQYDFTIDTQIWENKIQYQVPNLPQGDYETYVQFDQGFADNQWISSIPLDLFEVDADEISYGGQLITLAGSGFNLDRGLTIQIQEKQCLNILFISNSIVQCRTPSLNPDTSYLIVKQFDERTNQVLYGNPLLVTIRKKSISLKSINQTSILIQQSDRINYIGGTNQIDLVILGNNLIDPLYLNSPKVYLMSESLSTIHQGTILGDLTADQVQVQFKLVPYGRYLLEYMNDTIFSNNTIKIYVQGDTNLRAELVNLSLAGGQNITIYGQGFDLNKGNNKIFICGLRCDIQDVSREKIICLSPPLLSQSIIKEYPLQQRYFNNIDRNDIILSSTYLIINNRVGKQSLILEFQTLILLELKNISFTIPNDTAIANNFIGTKIQYQLNSQDIWKYYYVIDSTIKPGENSIQLTDSILNIKKLRIYDEQSKSRCNICELKIKGRLTQDIKTYYDQETKCGALVIVNDFQFPLIENVAQYQTKQTPFVESISSQYVPTDYGVNITIIGTGFGNQSSQIIVQIDRVKCNLFWHDETSINCTTGIKDLETNKIQGEFKVQIDGNIAINKQVVQHGNLWSDINTWGGYAFPIDGDSVIVKQGQILIVDIVTPKLISLFIEGSLLFADNGRLNSLDAQYLILHQGSLIIGSKENPYQSQAAMILRGEHNDTQLIGFGNKVFGCYQCNLQIFGKPKKPVWTFLNKTIEIGENQLLLDESVNWNIGDQIVVTSSDFDYKQSEIKIIIDIQQYNRLLIVDTPFQYQHYSNIEQYDDQLFQNKVEVGVLTRNIKIQGDQSKYLNNYGFNFKIYGSSTQNTLIQIQYTEFMNGGQTYYQGRYPIYLKQNNDLSGSFLIGNSIHNNNARCIVLNQVQNILIQNNICYNTKGHSIQLLSGLETNIKLIDNLIIYTKSSYLLDQRDISPAGFFITNPLNTIVGNRVAGSEYNGFSLDFTKNPDYIGEQDCRTGFNLTDFSNNSAHSNIYGLNILKFTPQELPCSPFVQQQDCYWLELFGVHYGFWGRYFQNYGIGYGQNRWIYQCPDPIYARSMKSYILNFKTWLNKQNGIQIYNVGNVELLNSQGADCKNSSIYLQQTDQSIEGFTINKGLIVKQSSNSKRIGQSNGIILPRTQICIIKNLTFTNFQQSDTIFVIDEQINTFTRNTTINYMMSGIRIINSQASIIDQSFKKAIFWDLDGSMMNQKPAYIFPIKNYLVGLDGCELQNSSQWKDIMFCQMDKVEIRDMTFIDLDGPFAIKRSSSDDSVIFNNTNEFDNNDLVLATGFIYDIYFPKLSNIYKTEIQLTLQNSNNDINISKGIIFRFNTHQQVNINGADLPAFIYLGSKLQTYNNFNPILPDSQFTLDNCNLGTNQYDKTTNNFQICIKQKIYKPYDQYIRLKISLISGQEFSPPEPETPTPTPSPDPVLPPDPEPEPIPINYKMVWSNTDAWESKQLPKYDEVAIIRQGYEITLDIDPPQLKQLIIIGSLIFDDKRNNTVLKSKNIWIKGGQMLAGNSTVPYKGKIEIQITSQYLESDNLQFIIEGLLNLYGVLPSTHFTRLIQFAQKGDDKIIVHDSYNWKAGDLIVIGPSGSDPKQSEEFIIKDIQDNLIKLSGQLKYNHFGDSKITLDQQGIGVLDMRAAVGLLTRNIQIGTGYESNPFTISFQQNFQNLVQGQIILQGVELSNSILKSNDQSPFLDIKQSQNGVLINGCSFHHFRGSFIKAQNTQSITIKNSIFYQGQTALVQLNNIRNLIFTNNLLMNTQQPNALFANFIYEDSTEITTDNLIVSDNVGQGSEDSGFLFMSTSCQNSNKYPFYNNQCSSTNFVCFSYKQSDGNCDYFGSAFAYHSQKGILASLQTKQIKVSQIILVENQINLIIKMGTDEIKNNQLQVSNSFISAFLRPYCQLCYSNELSPYCKSSVGIQIPTVTTKAFPPSILQFSRNDQLSTIEAVDARFYIFSLIFDGFNDLYTENTYCGKNSVFKQHPQAADASPQIYLTNTKCQNCNQAGLLYNLRTPDPSLLGWLGGCGSFQCTGQINILIEDQDGSFFGQIGQAIGNNFYFAPNVTYCTRVDSWVGFYCQGNQITVLNFMNTASDYNTRLYSPIQLTDGQFFNQINSFKEWSWLGDQPMNKRESKFISIVKSNSVINITNAGENPTESLYWLSRRKQSGSPTDYVIIQMQFSQQNIIQVSLNKNIFQPGITQSEDHWNLQDKKNECGANIYFNKNRTIHFVITGDINCYVKVSLKNTIQVTSRIALTQNSFLGKDFLQYAVAQLGGDPYNYFILSVRKISKRRNMQTEASYYDVEWGIVDPAPIGSQEAQDSKTRLTIIQEKITEMKSSTTSPYTVVSSQVNITTIDQLNFESSEKATPPTYSNQTVFIQNSTQTQSNDYLIIEIPKNNSNKNESQSQAETQTNKTELIPQNQQIENDKQQTWIIIVSVVVPIFSIALILLGIKLFLRYRKIRKYQEAPQIAVESNSTDKI
ncbi:hypothetical protein pb186bvf_005328 [Paramecium bursaria]